MQAGEAVSARLAGTLGIPAPPANSLATTTPVAQDAPAAAPPPNPEAPALVSGGSTPAPAPTELDALKAENLKLWRSVSKRMTKLMIAGTEWGLEAFGREAGDPDDDDVKDFQKALESQLGVWFGPKELTPVKQMLLSGSFIVGEMAMSSTKIPPKPREPKAAAPTTGPAPPGGNDVSTSAPAAGSGTAPTLRPV